MIQTRASLVYIVWSVSKIIFPDRRHLNILPNRTYSNILSNRRSLNVISDRTSLNILLNQTSLILLVINRLLQSYDPKTEKRRKVDIIDYS